MSTLDQVRVGHRCRIDRIDGPADLSQRLMEFGLLDGDEISVVGHAPLGDPIEIQVGGTRLSLRKSEAAHVTVTLL